MKYSKLILPIAALLVATSCSDDEGVIGIPSPAPAALVRVINVNVDTGTVDIRFIDQVENLPTFLGVPFRGSSGLYQRVIHGARPTRVFPTPTQAERDRGVSLLLTSTMLKDTTINLNADARYTVVYAGRVGGGQATLKVFNEDFTLPTPPASQIALSVLHASFGTGNVDVYIAPAATGASNTDFVANRVALVQNVSYLSKTPYVNVPVRPTTGQNLYEFVVTPAGSTTVLYRTIVNQPGVPTPAGQIYGPQPGVQIAGSVLTAVLTPGTVTGTRLATATTNAPAVIMLVDKSLNP